MKRILGAILTLAAVLIIGALLWLNFFRSEGPDEFALTDPATEQPTESSEYGSDSTDTALESADGAWTVAAGSEAGYRVLENLRGVKDFEVIGRTDQVTGSLAIADTTLNEATFEIDVASIATDSSSRDNAFKGGPVMNAAEFPTASFTLTEPVDFGSVPAPGESITVPVTGDLTLRGTTQTVTFDVQGRVLNGGIEIVGSIDVVFADYGIGNPSNAIATVRDEGQVEFKLQFEQ